MKKIYEEDEQTLYTITLDSSGYVLRIEFTNTKTDIYPIDWDKLDTLNLCAYKLINDKLVLDEERKKELEEERKNTPSWHETIEAQVVFTAMMTDTLLEE